LFSPAGFSPLWRYQGDFLAVIEEEPVIASCPDILVAEQDMPGRVDGETGMVLSEMHLLLEFCQCQECPDCRGDHLQFALRTGRGQPDAHIPSSPPDRSSTRQRDSCRFGSVRGAHIICIFHRGSHAGGVRPHGHRLVQIVRACRRSILASGRDFVCPTEIEPKTNPSDVNADAIRRGGATGLDGLGWPAGLGCVDPGSRELLVGRRRPAASGGVSAESPRLRPPSGRGTWCRPSSWSCNAEHAPQDRDIA